MSNVRSCPSSSSSSCASDPETIQHTSFECKAFVKERGKIPSGSYSVRPLVTISSIILPKVREKPSFLLETRISCSNSGGSKSHKDVLNL